MFEKQLLRLARRFSLIWDEPTTQGHRLGCSELWPAGSWQPAVMEAAQLFRAAFIAAMVMDLKILLPFGKLGPPIAVHDCCLLSCLCAPPHRAWLCHLSNLPSGMGHLDFPRPPNDTSQLTGSADQEEIHFRTAFLIYTSTDIPANQGCDFTPWLPLY